MRTGWVKLDPHSGLMMQVRVTSYRDHEEAATARRWS